MLGSSPPKPAVPPLTPMGAAARRLFQSPRQGEQGNLFSTGLKLSNVWYAHEKTNVRA